MNALDNYTFDPVDPWGDITANIAWALRSLTHRTLNATPGQFIVNRDMLFDLKYVADWETIHKRKYAQMVKDNHRENYKRRECAYKVGSEVLIKQDYLHILRKKELQNGGLFIVKEVNNERGTIAITDEQSISTMNFHIRLVPPFYEQ